MRATIVINIDERTGYIDKLGSLCQSEHDLLQSVDHDLIALLDNQLKTQYDRMRDALKTTIDQYRASLAAGVEAPKTADK